VLGVEYVRVDHILESGHVRGLVYTPSSLPLHHARVTVRGGRWREQRE
jgi:hypothetical protein